MTTKYKCVNCPDGIDSAEIYVKRLGRLYLVIDGNGLYSDINNEDGLRRLKDYYETHFQPNEKPKWEVC